MLASARRSISSLVEMVNRTNYHEALAKLLVGGVFGLAIGYFFPVLFYNYWATSKWVEAHKITPVLPYDSTTGAYQAKIGGELHLQLEVTYNDESEINSIYILACQEPEGNFDEYSRIRRTKLIKNFTEGKKVTIGIEYRADTPDTQKDCIIQPIKRLRLPMKVERNIDLGETKLIHFSP